MYGSSMNGLPPLSARRHPPGTGSAPEPAPTPRREVTTLSVGILCVVAFLACWLRDQTLLGVALLAAVALSGRMPRPRAADTLALLLGGWAVCTLFWTPDVGVSRTNAYLYVAATFLFVTVRHLVTTRVDLLLVGGAYLLGCTIRAGQVIADAEAAGISPSTGSMALSVRYGIEGFNINFTAYSLATGFLLALVLIRVGGLHRLLRLGLYGLLPVLAYAVLLNGTRGALFALVLGTGYFVVSRWAGRFCWPVALIGVPVLLVVVPIRLTHSALTWLDTLFAYRSTGDLAGRMQVWPYALQSWSESVLLGVGPGIFPVANPLGFGAHSLVLTVGNDLGLVGLVLFAAVVATALVPVARTAGGRRLTGLFLVGLLPIWMTGHWDVALGMWLLLGLTSVLTAEGGSVATEDGSLLTDPDREARRRPKAPNGVVPGMPVRRPTPGRPGTGTALVVRDHR
ncbi:O-antigen ligase family protein [Micromonospora sp. SH-82]|uniref:O-antigen ligase family protein n=1 Tax=Micromonospora sp. SH-82 TaxID=3132938 RepID=UPI003EC146FB